MMSQKRGLLFGISDFDFGHEVSSSLMMTSLSGLHSAFLSTCTYDLTTFLMFGYHLKVDFFKGVDPFLKPLMGLD